VVQKDSHFQGDEKRVHTAQLGMLETTKQAPNLFVSSAVKESTAPHAKQKDVCASLCKLFSPTDQVWSAARPFDTGNR